MQELPYRQDLLGKEHLNLHVLKSIIQACRVSTLKRLRGKAYFMNSQIVQDLLDFCNDLTVISITYSQYFLSVQALEFGLMQARKIFPSVLLHTF